MGRIYEKSGTIRSFNATSEVNEHIVNAKLKKGELTGWINSKIEQGILYEKNPKQEPLNQMITESTNLRIRL